MLGRKITTGNILLTMIGGFLLGKLLEGGKSDLPSPRVPERFVDQPMAVYVERVIWALTPDCDIKKIRVYRNLLNERPQDLEQCYRLQIPPDQVAMRVEALVEGRLESIVPEMQPSVPAQGPQEPSEE